MKQLESQEQQKIIRWWALACHHHSLPEWLLFAIPNGGARTQRYGARLKAEGMRPGVPDLMLAVPRGGHNALFIELKQGKGRLSLNQKAMLKLLEAQGYATAVPYGFEQARAAIENYLGEQYETTTGNSPCAENPAGTAQPAADEEGI